jgi:hypothetical protein
MFISMFFVFNFIMLCFCTYMHHCVCCLLVMCMLCWFCFSVLI